MTVSQLTAADIAELNNLRQLLLRIPVSQSQYHGLSLASCGLAARRRHGAARLHK